MPAKKRSNTKQSTPAPLPPVELNATPPKTRKAGTAPAQKASAPTDPKGAAQKVTRAAQPKAPTSAPRAKAPKAAKPLPAQVPVVAEAPIAAEAPVQPVRPAISVDDIRHAAFLLSQRRRGVSDPVADWLEAERLLGARAS